MARPAVSCLLCKGKRPWIYWTGKPNFSEETTITSSCAARVYCTVVLAIIQSQWKMWHLNSSFHQVTSFLLSRHSILQTWMEHNTFFVVFTQVNHQLSYQCCFGKCALLSCVALSDCFYCTRQATPTIAVISARRLESNSRGKTFRFSRGTFMSPWRRQRRTVVEGYKVSGQHMASWILGNENWQVNIWQGGWTVGVHRQKKGREEVGNMKWRCVWVLLCACVCFGW